MKRSILFLVVLSLQDISGIIWDRSRCSPDPDQMMPEGASPDIGRFPWLGVVQHNFLIGGQPRFAVTTGVFIHPKFAIALAEDIAKIAPSSVMNNTKFIVWYSKSIKFVLDVTDYTLHPEYSEGVTVATLALLEINTRGEIGVPEVGTPILPVCLNIEGGGTLDDLYVIKMTDVQGELTKEAFKMDFVENKDCDEFYQKAQLTYTKMKPTYYLCAMSQHLNEVCVWDGGMALVSRHNWGYWKLIGFGTRGPGCGAPARFILVANYLQWIHEVVSQSDSVGIDDDHIQKITFRRVSPIELVMFPGDGNIVSTFGQCERGHRGNVLYKDSSQLRVNKNFVQAYYYASVMQIAQYSCAVVQIDAMTRSNAAVWVEHHCHRELTGLSPKMTGGPDFRKLECFMYYKSKAFIEFRFYFSFSASIELTLFGKEEPHFVGKPFDSTEATEDWSPTSEYLRWGLFRPYYIAWYNM
ncbi:hypothetical protein ACJJTC_009664 [Scirpophaga incertulas]